MKFELFGFEVTDFYGFWIFDIETDNWQSSLFGIYCNDGDLFVDLFFFRKIFYI